MPRLTSLTVGAVAIAGAATGCASTARTAPRSAPVALSSPVTAVSSPTTTVSSGPTCPPRAAPTPDANGVIHGVVIDWIDAIAFDGHQYIARDNTPIAPTKLDQIVGRVQCTLDGNPNVDPSYRMRDGDATYLPTGTAVYSVKGTPQGQALAAEHDGVIRLYQVDPSS